MAGSLGGALAALAVTAVLVSVMQFALYPGSGVHPVWALDLFTVCGLVYAAAGLAAW
jgi:hypothetical protein